MAAPELKHFGKTFCIFFHCISYLYLCTQMSSTCLQMRRPGCRGFQENRLLQQSGHSQHTVETAKKPQIFLAFRTHWDFTDKAGDRTEILLPTSEASANLGAIPVQRVHTERTFWKLFSLWKSARNLPLWLSQKVISHERQKYFGIYVKNFMSEKQSASHTKHCNPPKQIYPLCKRTVADDIFK